MIRIPQHCSSGDLNDLQKFIVDLEPVQRQVSYWLVRIEECVGPGSYAFAELTEQCARLSHLAFASLCYCIDQVIDGKFIAYLADREIARLRAIDSTFWEITGSTELERVMLSKYGAYVESFDISNFGIRSGMRPIDE